MPTTKFNIVLDVPLSASQVKTLKKEIDAVVLKHVAGLRLPVDNFGSRIPNKEWLGIWLKYFATKQHLLNSKSFTKVKGF
jgi:hypothetical protein